MKRAQKGLLALLLAAMVFPLYWKSPVVGIADSHYTLLVSHQLLRHQSFDLSDYFQPPVDLDKMPGMTDKPDGERLPYQLERRGARLLYFYPPASPVLSVPLLAIAEASGLTPLTPQGTYDAYADLKLEHLLASVITTATVVMLLLTGLELLPAAHALLLALAFAFGTSLWTTSAACLWSHTWGALLLSMLIYLLLRMENGKAHPVLLGTLLSWLYFTRPTFSLTIVAVTVFAFLRHRKCFPALLATGAVWLGLFVTWSLLHWGDLLPPYYRLPMKLSAESPLALYGTLLSPSRGLLVYSPFLAALGWLWLRYKNTGTLSPWAGLCAGAILAHVLSALLFPDWWWAGYSYGARYSMDYLPWLFLLAACTLKAWRESKPATSRQRVLEWITLCALVLLSVWIQSRGAFDKRTWWWNLYAREDKARHLDWRYPQFLAGYLPVPDPFRPPPVEPGTTVFLAQTNAIAHLGRGWDRTEAGCRWTTGREARFAFSLGAKDPRRIFISGVAVARAGGSQTIRVFLNNHELHAFTWTHGTPATQSLALPPRYLRAGRNVLSFHISDPVQPDELGMNSKSKDLGLAIYNISFR